MIMSNVKLRIRCWSYKQVGNFFGDKKIALGQFLKALLEHKIPLPHDCTFPASQSLNHIFVFPDSLPQQTESDFLTTSFTKHHYASHSHLIDVNVQQLSWNLVSCIVKIKESSVITKHQDFFKPMISHILLQALLYLRGIQRSFREKGQHVL